jgi:GT2 family glycosyltransferase
VTVVVPTVDRVELLERCLAALEQQTRAPDEVLVVHDGNPGVAALLSRWSHRLPLVCLVIDQRGVSAKRNAGWRAARHELIAFTDDDCAPSPGWLAAFGAAEGDVLAGPVAPHPDDAAVSSVFGRTIVIDREGPYFPGANVAYTRKALELTGGFDEQLAAGEDTDLAWRLKDQGGRATWVPAAEVLHAVRPVSFPDHLRSLWRWRCLPLVVRRHPELREVLHGRVFWKASHPVAALALLGLVLSTRRPSALVLASPLLVQRWRERGPRFGTQVAVADVTEVAVVALGSLRHRSVLL